MNKFYFPILLLIVLSSTSWLRAADGMVQLECEIKGCESDLFLYIFNGFDFEEVARSAMQEEGVYTFQVPSSNPRFYYLGVQKDQAKPIVLGGEKLVRVRGNCANIRSVQVTSSPLNKQYIILRGKLATLTRDANVQIRALSEAYRAQEETAATAAITELQEIDRRKTTLLDSIRQEDDFLYAITGLNTLLSYQNNPGEYGNEVEYFGNEFFRFVDLSHPAMAGNSMIYEAFRNYAATLSSVGMKSDMHLAFLKNSLARTGDNLEAYKLALGGVLSALEKTSHANYKPLAEEFIQKYGDKEPAITAILKQKLVALKGITVGGEAPDFSQATPDGEELKLSELRGKIVLVDFWASWCGPCRRENPNVVKLYNQYKEKGFEILGVSLDRDKDRWLQAIEADQLTWHHVSDLKGWSNEAAKMYGVRSIPHTVLLDAEGKVMARNLRGEALAQKLEELFGGKPAGQGK
jgi:peroxiredoxin